MLLKYLIITMLPIKLQNGNNNLVIIDTRWNKSIISIFQIFMSAGGVIFFFHIRYFTILRTLLKFMFHFSVLCLCTINCF